MENSTALSKIGYILIDRFKTDKPKVCEAPRHKGLGFPAYAVVAVISDLYDEPVVQMVCKQCWNHFAISLGKDSWEIK